MGFYYSKKGGKLGFDMSAPKRIQELVKKFSDNFEYYQAIDYKEQELRHEFLNPFFQELGWDMENTAGKGADRDVHYEKRVKGKAPDFGFYLDGKLRFFVEAKNPTKNVCNDPLAASQLRTYGWSSKIPRSVLTDFEEFSIYDTTARPKQNDSARVARLDCIHYKEYIERWDEIVGLFSREAVIAGSLEKLSKKRAKEAVDAGLLEDISKWRELLAKNIALRNAGLTEEQVNRLVQDTLDRLIFLRICEDRGIEPEERLREAVDGEGLYGRLFKIFKKAEQRYDSGLFDLKPLAADLVVDDKTISEIISELYFPKSPYKFDAIPAEILGQVYEQFLGKVIRLTAGHHAKVEDKPEVRKAGGVYYTPTYIVEYIVENTVGKLIEGKSPKEIATLSVLDPACGSGSFLIGAYQYLMDWYRDWYAEHDAKKHVKNKLIYHDADGVWQLTLAERTRILLAHIYGVDIDRQAVEVAKLSLMLKALELSEQQSLFNDRILPVLSSNIKCGNSLIGTDYFAGQMMMDPAEMARINPFDWEPEFPEIFKRGGFDAVIGNPPYVLGRETFDEDTKDYFAKSYFVYGGKYDLYIYFTEKAISLLTASGKLGYIIPNTVLVNENAVKLRKVILDKTQIDIIRIFEERVFENAQVESVIVIASKKPTTSRPIIIESGRKVSYISQESFVNDRNFRFNVRLDPSTEKLITRITLQSNTLGNLSDICIGIQLGGSSGTDTKENFLSNTQIEKNYKKVLDGKDINSYEINWNNKFVRYGNWLHRKRDEKYFLNPKVMIRQIGAVPIATFDDQGFYTLNTIYNLISISDYSSKYFLAIINSKFGKWFWRTQNSDFKSLFPKIKKSQIENIPIRLVNFSDSTDRSLYDKVISFVDQILALNKQLSVAKSLSERVALQRQITATDRQIDQLVYKLYGLTEEEIKIVEEGTK